MFQDIWISHALEIVLAVPPLPSNDATVNIELLTMAASTHHWIIVLLMRYNNPLQGGLAC